MVNYMQLLNLQQKPIYLNQIISNFKSREWDNFENIVGW